jgi:hypothetical protein
MSTLDGIFEVLGTHELRVPVMKDDVRVSATLDVRIRKTARFQLCDRERVIRSGRRVRSRRLGRGGVFGHPPRCPLLLPASRIECSGTAQLISFGRCRWGMAADGRRVTTRRMRTYEL